MLQGFLHRRFVISLGLIFVVVVAPGLAKVKRQDTVIMKNGDRLTGEVKRLEQGILYIETDYFSGPTVPFRSVHFAIPILIVSRLV
jgi:hypothetical protein